MAEHTRVVRRLLDAAGTTFAAEGDVVRASLDDDLLRQVTSR
ncbi:hypothetical protein [Mycobacterium sp.]